MRAAILGFAAGVLLLQWQGELPGAMLVAAVAMAALTAAVILWRLRGAPRALAGAAAGIVLGVCLGFAWAALLAHARLSESLAPGLEGREIEVSGVVASLPQPLPRGVRFEFEVEHPPPAQGVPRRILLTWFNGLAPAEFRALSPLRAGERWRLAVRLRQPRGLANPHGFDYEAWLLERGIRASGIVGARGGATRIDALALSPSHFLGRLRERLRERYWDALPQARHGGVLVALALGEQRAIGAEEWRVFTRTGVSHLMSISGLHVTMVAALAAWLVFNGWRRSPRLALALPAQKAAAAAGFAAALAYCLVSGFAVPAQRTLYMVGVVALALWRDRASSPSRVLAFALGLVLVLDPWAVLSAGFWLSFGAVAIILYVAAGRPAPRGWLAQWGVVQGAVTVGLAPFLLVLFQQVSLVSPLANAVAIPVVSLAVTPLALAAAVLPFDWPLVLADLLLAALVSFLERLAALDIAVWQQAAPPAWSVAPALAGVAWLLAPRGVPARPVGLALMLPLFSGGAGAPPGGEAWLTFFDVGQGSAVLVRTARHALLYDAGPAWGSDADAGVRVLAPYLRAEGIRALDALVVSHEDADHAGGAASVLAALPVGRLISTLSSSHPAVGMARYRSACRAGTSWAWDGVQFRVLYPAEGDNPWTSLNDRSCVLRIEAGGTAALLAGDIGRRAEQRLVEADPALLRAQLLLAPHHGSGTSSSAAFIEAVAAARAVFQAGYANRFGHPRAEVLERYRASGAQVVRTDLAGAYTARIGPSGIAGTSYRQVERRYWRSR